MTCRRHADHLEVAVYWVGVANQNEFNTLSLCMQTLDFAGEEQKTEGELENDIPENCAHSLYEQQCMHCQSLHTQSNQKSCREYSKQLTTGYTILTYPTSTRSAWSDFSRKCPLFGEKKYYKQIHSVLRFHWLPCWACINFTCAQNGFDRTCAICFWIEKCKFGLK